MAMHAPPLDAARQSLVESYIPYAQDLARRRRRQLHPAVWDEVESAALLGLVEAAARYEPERGYQFKTYARHRITGAIRDALRGWSMMTPHRLRGGATRPSERTGGVLTDDPSGELVAAAQPEPPPGADLEAAEELEQHLAALPTDHAATLRRRFLAGETHAQQAGARGCSSAWISRLYVEAGEMLRGETDVTESRRQLESWKSRARRAQARGEPMPPPPETAAHRHRRPPELGPETATRLQPVELATTPPPGQLDTIEPREGPHARPHPIAHPGRAAGPHGPAGPPSGPGRYAAGPVAGSPRLRIERRA
jgi:RNA polymerase sigma factor (sigma-70 family)